MITHVSVAVMYVADQDASLDFYVNKLAITLHIDGFGGRAAKLSKYHALRMERPFFNGFKLFLDEDVDMFSPREVMRKLKPRPNLLTYE